MRNVIARGALVSGLATALVTGAGATPAQAAGSLQFTADVTLYGFGNGTGTARLCVAGLVGGTPIVNPNTCDSVTGSAGANAFASFTMDHPPATCPVYGTAQGTVSGAVTTNFSWTRLGAFVVITTSGGSFGNGHGVAWLLVTSPAGNPCGNPGVVRASAAGLVDAV